ncbi:hypothetical protein CW751_04110 [Brumimicrobium salinarum]|uniref:Uncharacterized protein n=1 Tax=Brumimicrobium salinarum TaxID=2058658 RepID=A0A2I0R599_9FLAO|nr:hypothetical protein [Brumimicrobium salinarum]PKR81719.1 hypothetical protein CW751_04110 [Brumimicrobium salinarum]
MQELKPLTISNSILGAPSVLLTSEMERFVFVQPLNQTFLLTLGIYETLYKHFKIEKLPVGVFKLKDVNYLCAKQPEGLLEVDEWMDCLWTDKRKYNRLLNPKDLFKMFLINLYFPVFSSTKKMVLPGKKDRFIIDAYPIIEKDKGLFFKPKNANDLGINKGEFKRLFRYFRFDLPQIIAEFEELHHENLYTDLKYQVSLYPNIRNASWNELKKCFDTDFKTFAKAEIENYILKL